MKWKGVGIYLGVILFVIYELFGFRFYLEFLDVINSGHKDYFEVLYGDGKTNGIYIGVLGKKIFFWGPNVLSWRNVDSLKTLDYYNVCTEDNLILSKASKNVILKSRKLDMILFKKIVKQGNYISFDNERAMLSVWDYWYFDNTGLVDQCRRY